VPALERAAPSKPLNAALDKLIRRAMAKRREDRFENARAMLQELSRILSEQPGDSRHMSSTRAQPRVTSAQLGRWWRAGLRGLSALGIAVITTEVALAWLLLRNPDDRAALMALGALVSERISSAVAPAAVAETGSAHSANALSTVGSEQVELERRLGGGAVDAATTPQQEALALPSADAGQPAPAGNGAAATALASAGAAAGSGQPAAAGAAAVIQPSASGAPASAGQPAPTPKPHVVDPGVPGPPRPRNPWSRPVPPELRGFRKAIQSGAVGDDRITLALRAYSQAHPGDARGHLLLGMMYLNRNWRPDAVSQFANALREDLSARGAPEVLEKLTGLVVLGKAASDAANLIVRAYGSEALPAIDAQLKANHPPEAVARLKTLRARIAPAHP
jgi:hypothetical protein